MDGVVHITNRNSPLVRDAGLDGIDFDYHPTYKQVACGSCCTFVIRSHVCAHLKKHHFVVSEARLDKIFAGYELVDNQQVTRPESYGAPVDGLAIVKGLACEAHGCQYACRSEKVMQTHIKNIHGPNAKTKWTDTHVQSFFGSPRVYFAVDRTQMENGPKDAYHLFMQDHRAGFKTQGARSSNNPNDVPPLLRMTQWHVKFKDIRSDREARERLLAGLGAVTAKEEVVSKVKDLVVAYYEYVREICRPVEQVVKRMFLEYPA